MAVLASGMIFCACTALAQREPEDFSAAARAPKVTVLPIPLVVVAPGKSAPLKVQFRVAGGYHINSNAPKSDLLVPTTLNLNVPNDIMIAKLKYPAGTSFQADWQPGEQLSVYSGRFTVNGIVAATRTAVPGRYRVHGSLRYQACDNRQCYSPRKVPVEFDVRVARQRRHSVGRNPGQSPHIHR